MLQYVLVILFLFLGALEALLFHISSRQDVSQLPTHCN